jgi:outer membrane biosynthesis protein TonB
MRKLLTLAIPIVLGVGVLTAALNSPQDDKPAAPRSQAGVASENALPAVIEESPTSVATIGDTTSTTVAAPTPAPAPAPETTTTTAQPKPKPAPAPTTTTAKPTAPVKLKPVSTTTTTQAPASSPEPTEAAAEEAAPSTIDCGQGTASARAIYGSNSETTALYAEVQNDSNREIELDRLVVRATYAEGGMKTYDLAVAGRRIQPGEKLVLSIPESTPQGHPSEFSISEFGFHTACMPECASR